MIGCEGERGPMGPPGKDGEDGTDYTLPAGPTYLGDNVNKCNHCHDGKVESWGKSKHFQAYTDLGESKDNPYCQQCHTTGFDTKYDYSGNVVSTGTDTTGFDDNHSPELYGVQCESCHGPMGPTIYDHAPNFTEPLHGTTCENCHEQGEEWKGSGHGTVLADMTEEEFVTEWGRSTCYPCHTSEGFIMANDPDWASMPFPADPYIINCATCHDPHGSSNPNYIRTMKDVAQAYPTGSVIKGLGSGMLCAQCHKARRDSTNIAGQINKGGRMGPHESPQSDMVAGIGSYEIPGYTYNREMNHNKSIMPDNCVTCHMYAIERGETDGPLYGHSFKADVRACQQCHGSSTADFNVGGVQAEIMGLLEELEALLPAPDDTQTVAEAIGDTTKSTKKQREAGYAYLFIESDGSHGVHNPAYTKSLLENAIAYLKED